MPHVKSAHALKLPHAYPDMHHHPRLHAHAHEASPQQGKKKRKKRPRNKKQNKKEQDRLPKAAFAPAHIPTRHPPKSTLEESSRTLTPNHTHTQHTHSDAGPSWCTHAPIDTSRQSRADALAPHTPHTYTCAHIHPESAPPLPVASTTLPPAATAPSMPRPRTARPPR